MPAGMRLPSATSNSVKSSGGSTIVSTSVIVRSSAGTLRVGRQRGSEAGRGTGRKQGEQAERDQQAPAVAALTLTLLLPRLRRRGSSRGRGRRRRQAEAVGEAAHELGAGVVAVVGVLGERSHDDVVGCRREIRPRARSAAADRPACVPRARLVACRAETAGTRSSPRRRHRPMSRGRPGRRGCRHRSVPAPRSRSFRRSCRRRSSLRSSRCVSSARSRPDMRARALGPAAVEEDVGRLDVTVDQLLRVGGVERLGYLPEDGDEADRRKRAFGLEGLLEVGGDVTASR